MYGPQGPTGDIARVREGPEGPSKWQRIPEVIQALWGRGCDSGGPEAVWKRSGARTKSHFLKILNQIGYLRITRAASESHTPSKE